MNKIKQWWIDKDIAPPHLIAWRLFAYVFVFTGAVLHSAGILLGWGWEEAKIKFKENL